MLHLPDGTEFAGGTKETDSRIEEIVGLSKSQFMQVAMIAQGEFMELLRAKSTDKKEIFRRLFRTEQYDRIVKELDRRRREKQREMAQVHTVCRTVAQGVRVPEDDCAFAELSPVRERMLKSETLSITDLEALVAAGGLSMWKDAAVFLVLIIVLLFKPTGFMGRKLQEKV